MSLELEIRSLEFIKVIKVIKVPKDLNDFNFLFKNIQKIVMDKRAFSFLPYHGMRFIAIHSNTPYGKHLTDR